MSPYGKTYLSISIFPQISQWAATSQFLFPLQSSIHTTASPISLCSLFSPSSLSHCLAPFSPSHPWLSHVWHNLSLWYHPRGSGHLSVVSILASWWIEQRFGQNAQKQQSVDLLKVEYTPTDGIGPEQRSSTPWFSVSAVIYDWCWKWGIGVGWLIDRRRLHNLFLTVHLPTHNAFCYNCMPEMQSICMKL
jgi:hypothetical protein